MATFHVEYTDTFGGEPNYSWVARTDIDVPENASQALIMRRAKRALGISGTRGEVTDFGDSFEFRPYRQCRVMFVTFAY